MSEKVPVFMTMYKKSEGNSRKVWGWAGIRDGAHGAKGENWAWSKRT